MQRHAVRATAATAPPGGSAAAQPPPCSGARAVSAARLVVALSLSTRPRPDAQAAHRPQESPAAALLRVGAAAGLGIMSSAGLAALQLDAYAAVCRAFYAQESLKWVSCEAVAAQYTQIVRR